MEQKEKLFINSLCTVLNALSNLRLKFECTPDANTVGMDTESDIKNYYLHIKVSHNSEPFFITVGSNDRVLLTFNSDNTGFSTEPRSIQNPYIFRNMKRITYGKNTISKIEEDIKKIVDDIHFA